MSKRNYFDIFFFSMRFKGIEEINKKLLNIGENGYLIKRTNFLYLTCTKELGTYNYIVDYYSDDGNSFNNSINIDDWMYLGRSGNIMLWREKITSSKNISLLSKDKIKYYNRKILKKDTMILSICVMLSILLSCFDVWSFIGDCDIFWIRNISLVMTVGCYWLVVWFFKTIKKLLDINK